MNLTPEQAAAIARKIGMLGSSAGQGQWFEAQGLAVCTTPSLPTYLLTGDRPLRVLVTLPGDPEVGLCYPDCEPQWYCGAGEGRVFSEWGSTPAEAILACAAAIEGEGT